MDEAVLDALLALEIEATAIFESGDTSPLHAQSIRLLTMIAFMKAVYVEVKSLSDASQQLFNAIQTAQSDLSAQVGAIQTAQNLAAKVAAPDPNQGTLNIPNPVQPPPTAPFHNSLIEASKGL